MAIEREIRHQAFQLGTLLTELPQFAPFTEAQPHILALPHVKRLLADVPNCRHTSTTVVPPSASRRAARICSSVCPRRRVILLGQEDHVAGRFLKLSLAYFLWFWVTGSFGTNKWLDS
jgi:hypothetical protein